MIERPPEDPAEHAKEFALRWAHRLEVAVEGRMHALDVPEEQVGSSDHAHGIAGRTFFPDDANGDTVSPGGRINVDSGVLNPDLLDEPYGEEAGAVWAAARPRDRIDAIIIHELAEADLGSHEEALKAASTTDRPISEGARRILRAMESGGRA